MLALGRTYGWRAGELIELCVGQVDLTTRTVRLEGVQTRNGESRIVRPTGEGFELVHASVTGKRPTNHVLTYGDGNPVRADRSAWEQLCLRAGIGHFAGQPCGSLGPATTATGRVCSVCVAAKKRKMFAFEGTLFHDLRRSAVRNMERAGRPTIGVMRS